MSTDIEDLTDWIKKLIVHNNTKAFYKTTTWKHIRKEILKEQNNDCQVCKSKGKHTEANTVHHIKHLRDRPDLAIDKGNLIAICEECHYNVHHRRENKPQLNTERW